MTDEQLAQPQSTPQPASEPPESVSAAPVKNFVAHPNFLIRLGRTLIRGVLMLIYFVLFEILNYLVFGIAALQFLAITLTARPIGFLESFNEGLSAYMGDISGYLTCVDVRAPFPFSRLRGNRTRPLPVGWKKRQDADEIPPVN